MIELFNKILKRHNIDKVEFGKKIGMTPQGVRNGSAPSTKSIPKWVKSFLFGYRLGGKKPKEKTKT